MAQRYTPLKMALAREEEQRVRVDRARNVLLAALRAPNSRGSPLFNHVAIALLILDGKR